MIPEIPIPLGAVKNARRLVAAGAEVADGIEPLVDGAEALAGVKGVSEARALDREAALSRMPPVGA